MSGSSESAVCSSCPTGYYTSSTGASSCDSNSDCSVLCWPNNGKSALLSRLFWTILLKWLPIVFLSVCATGYYMESGSCTPCLEGYYQDQVGQTSCTKCTVLGRTTTAQGSTASSSCSGECFAAVPLQNAQKSWRFFGARKRREVFRLPAQTSTSVKAWEKATYLVCLCSCVLK